MAPALFMQARNDKIIAMSHVEALANKYAGPRKLASRLDARLSKRIFKKRKKEAHTSARATSLSLSLSLFQSAEVSCPRAEENPASRVLFRRRPSSTARTPRSETAAPWSRTPFWKRGKGKEGGRSRRNIRRATAPRGSSSRSTSKTTSSSRLVPVCFFLSSLFSFKKSDLSSARGTHG